MSELDIRRNDEQSRYEAWLDGQRIGLATMIEQDDAVLLPHVEIDPRHGGRGYAGQLTRAALDDLRERGVPVVARCPYVRTWVTRHPEYQDFVSL